MRSTIAALFVTALSIPGFAQAPAANPGDESAIRKVIQQQDAARNTGDWKALGALFTDDADQLTSAGEWRKGRAQIEKEVGQSMSTNYKGGKFTTTLEAIRFVAPTVAVADGTFEIANVGKGGSRRGRTTYVLVKANNAWRIAMHRSMVPTPVGATR